MTRGPRPLDPAQLALFESAPRGSRVPGPPDPPPRQAATPQAVTPQAAPPQAATPQAATPQAATPQAATPQAPPTDRTLPDPAPSAAESVPGTAAALPAVFRHPAADREIRLQDRVVAYSLKRGRRRSIGFLVGAEGLSVHVPKWIGVGDIESALHEKSRWILRKLADQQERSQRLAAARIDWRDGATVPFLGEPLVLRVDAAVPARGEAARWVGASPGAGPALHLGLPPNASAAQLRDAVQRWLKRRAREVFEARLAVFAARIGVQCTRLSLSSAQSRWGSASADGSIRLNWRLVHFALPMIDYVVVHELAHLREMNHSPRFWDVVRQALPDFEQARDALRDGSVPMFD